MSDGAMRKLLQKTLGVDATVHGFRSSFKDWASETTNHPNEVSEMALAHTIGNKTEAAYRRGDLLQKRKELMQDWSDFLCSKNGKVIRLEKGAAYGRHT
jgi:integrase